MTEVASGETVATFSSHGQTYRLAVLHGRDIEIISPLLVEVYGRKAFDPAFVRRKYSCERDGVRAFACVAMSDSGDRPVATVGMLPWPIRHGAHVELAGQLADSATSKAHRGRGLHVRLMTLAHEKCAAAGMTFVFRFSNKLSFAITTSKLGYSHLGDLVEYAQPVRTVWAERLARRTRLGSVYDSVVDRILEPFLEPGRVLESSALAEGYAGVARDREFFEYKERFGRSRVVNLAGASVWLAVNHGILVGDITARSDSDLDRGLDALRRLSRRLGANRVLFQVPDDVRIGRFLATRWQETRRRPLAYFDLSSKIPPSALRFTFGDIDGY